MILYTAHTLVETLFVNMTKKQMQELHAIKPQWLKLYGQRGASLNDNPGVQRGFKW